MGKFHPPLPFSCSLMSTLQALVSPAAPPPPPSCSPFHNPIFSPTSSGQPSPLSTSVSPSGKEDKVRRRQVSPFPLQEHQQREWMLVCNTIYLSYSKIILESKGAIFMHLDAILALVLQHYHNCILEKVLPAYSTSPTSHLCHLFSSPPRKRCLALNGSQGVGLVQ